MFNLFKVYPGDMAPNREYFIGTVATREEAEAYVANYNEQNPEQSSWDPWISIREIKLMKI